MSERFAAWVWQHQQIRGPLVCSDGREVQIVYPGRTWGDGQPDFQGALIAWQDGRLEHGDVEVHLEPRGWWQHGHQRDPAYRDVILHVVLSSRNERPVLTVAGETVPTLTLEPYLTQPLESLLRAFEADEAIHEPECVTERSEAERLLDEGGVQRFYDKATALEGDLTALPPSELLWRGVARALGYTRNADAMSRLAERVPLGELRSLLARLPDGDAATSAFAVLLGSAGLLPSQRGFAPLGVFAEQIESTWCQAEALGRSEPSRALRWELCRVRPGNHPVRRIAALAVLGAGLDTDDPVEELARLTLEPGAVRSLLRRFTVAAPSRDWGELVDLCEAGLPTSVGLVGRDRAVEIVVNAVLPLLHAHGRYWDHQPLAAASLEAYRSFPASAGSGLTRHMATRLFGPEGPRLASSACRQQGLLQIFRSTCFAHACGRCPAGTAEGTAGAAGATAPRWS